MAFTIVDRTPGGTKGKIANGQSGEASETWTVIADGDHYDTEDVRNASIFGRPYESRHPKNQRLILMPYEVTQDDESPRKFTAELTWTSEPLKPEQEEQKEANPLNRRARITVKTAYEKEIRHRDFRGKAKVNSAGDLFDPPIENNRSYRVIIIRKNVTVFPDWVFDFADAVNSMPFVIKGRVFPKGWVWMADIALGEIQYDIPGIPYCEAVIEMHVKKPRKPRSGENPNDVPTPWVTEQLDEGLHQLVGGVRKRITAPDDQTPAQQQPVASPVCLDGNGLKLDPVTVDNAKFILFYDHDYMDFNQIAYLWSDA